MADKRITDMASVQSMGSTESFIIDSVSNGTRQITYENVFVQIKTGLGVYTFANVSGTLTLTDPDGTQRGTVRMDSAPTAGSNNPVTSGGIKTALDNVQAAANKGINSASYANNVITLTPVSGNPLTITLGNPIVQVAQNDNDAHILNFTCADGSTVISIITADTTYTATSPLSINASNVISATFDTVPTSGSNNFISSGAVYAAIENASDSLQAEVDEIKNQTGLGTNDVVGVCIDFENKTWKRLGAAENWNAGSDFDVMRAFGGRHRCNVSDTGSINAVYGDSGYVEDGSNGQVMVFQPKFYYKVVPLKLEKNTTSAHSKGFKIRKANYYISDTPKTGFKVHPAFLDGNGNEREGYYIGAFPATAYDVSASDYFLDNTNPSTSYSQVDQSTDKLASIANATPLNNFTRPQFETLAKNRGNGWHNYFTQIAMAEFLLMFIEGAQNVQSAFGTGITSQADNSSYCCACFSGSTTGNASMEATSTKDYTGTAQTASGKKAMSYRGVENEYGNIWQMIYGINIWGDGSMDGGEPYICDDPANFIESSHSGNYVGAGFTVANADGYINAFGYGDEDYDWLLMPAEVGGNSSLPIGDYFYKTANLNGYRIARLGARWADGLGAGLDWDLSNGVGGRLRYVGARLVFLREEAI